MTGTLETLYRKSIQGIDRLPFPQKPGELIAGSLFSGKTVTEYKHWGDDEYSPIQVMTTVGPSELPGNLSLTKSPGYPSINSIIQGKDGYSIWQWRGKTQGWIRLQPPTPAAAAAAAAAALPTRLEILEQQHLAMRYQLNQAMNLLAACQDERDACRAANTPPPLPPRPALLGGRRRTRYKRRKRRRRKRTRRRRRRRRRK